MALHQKTQHCCVQAAHACQANWFKLLTLFEHCMPVVHHTGVFAPHRISRAKQVKSVIRTTSAWHGQNPIQCSVDDFYMVQRARKLHCPNRSWHCRRTISPCKTVLSKSFKLLQQYSIVNYHIVAPAPLLPTKQINGKDPRSPNNAPTYMITLLPLIGFPSRQVDFIVVAT